MFYTRVLLLLFTLAVFTTAYQRPKEDYITEPKLWPMPNNITLGTERVNIENPCLFALNLTGPKVTKLYDKVFTFYKEKLFPNLDCDVYMASTFELELFLAVDQELESSHNHKLHATIKETAEPEYPQLFMNENYTLAVNATGVYITADAYWGFVRGLETLSQLIYSVKRTDKGGKNPRLYYYIPATPIAIEDWPAHPHRGVMLDGSRHYLSVDALKRNIEGLAYNRMNVLHWHIIDADAFPLWITELPHVTKAGAFSKRQTYHPEQITEVVEHGRMLGVRVVPEIETPGHTRSWALSEEFYDILSCRVTNGPCAQPPCGQINPTLNKTMMLVKSVVDQVLKLFPDNVVHFGGDEVMNNCWSSDPSLAKAEIGQLAPIFQRRQKEMIGKRRASYWGDSPFKGDNNDVIQMWSGSTSGDFYWIASYASAYYLDCGLGNLFGQDGTWCEPLKTWRSIFSQTLEVEKREKKFVGVENPLFGEMNNDATVDQKVWPRVSATGEITWTANRTLPKWNATVDRLAHQVKRMVQRGMSPFPASMTFCEINPATCFK